ncbi:MAG: hypothetical protein ACFUZC_10215 [Chthoniobacteraceae bacterium]
MKQIILQATRKQYDDLLKLLDRRCTIRTDEITDFQSVRAMVRAAKVVDIPETSGKRIVRTVPIEQKPTASTESAPPAHQP